MTTGTVTAAWLIVFGVALLPLWAWFYRRQLPSEWSRIKVELGPQLAALTGRALSGLGGIMGRRARSFQDRRAVKAEAKIRNEDQS